MENSTILFKNVPPKIWMFDFRVSSCSRRERVFEKNERPPAREGIILSAPSHVGGPPKRTLCGPSSIDSSFTKHCPIILILVTRRCSLFNRVRSFFAFDHHSFPQRRRNLRTFFPPHDPSTDQYSSTPRPCSSRTPPTSIESRCLCHRGGGPFLFKNFSDVCIRTAGSEAPRYGPPSRAILMLVARTTRIL